MKSIISKVFSCLLTVLLVVQVVICVILMLRSAGGGDGSLFGYRFYYIVSPSMEPTIKVGSQIVVRETDTDTLEVNDIITFASADPEIKGYPNTHRIVGKTTDENGREAFVTKGDNNTDADTYPVYPEDIYGEVVVIAPALKGLIMFYSFASTPIGFTVVVVMPLLLIFGIVMRSFVRELKKGACKTEDESKTVVYSKELIYQLVKAYIAENPGKELNMAEANDVAEELIKALVQKGDGTDNG